MYIVTIEIRYLVNGISVLQRGEFPVKRRKYEEIALEWFNQVKREMNVDCLQQVMVNGDDITDKVKELDI